MDWTDREKRLQEQERMQGLREEFNSLRKAPPLYASRSMPENDGHLFLQGPPGSQRDPLPEAFTGGNSIIDAGEASSSLSQGMNMSQNGYTPRGVWKEERVRENNGHK